MYHVLLWRAICDLPRTMWNTTIAHVHIKVAWDGGLYNKLHEKQGIPKLLFGSMKRFYLEIGHQLVGCLSYQIMMVYSNRRVMCNVMYPS